METWKLTVLLLAGLALATPAAMALSTWDDWDSDWAWGDDRRTVGDDDRRETQERRRSSGDEIVLRLTDGEIAVMDERAYFLLLSYRSGQVTDEDVLALENASFDRSAWNERIVIKLTDGKLVPLSAGAWAFLRALEGNETTDEDVLAVRNAEYVVNPRMQRSISLEARGPDGEYCQYTAGGYECGGENPYRERVARSGYDRSSARDDGRSSFRRGLFT